MRKPNVMKGVWGLDGVEQFPPAATVNQRKRGIEMKVLAYSAWAEWAVKGLVRIRVTKGDGGGESTAAFGMPKNAQAAKFSGRHLKRNDRASVTVEVGRNAG